VPAAVDLPSVDLARVDLVRVDLLHPDLGGLTAGVIYVVVFGLVFVESGLVVGFLLPGDTVLFTAGLLAADPGNDLSVPVLAIGVAVAGVLGDVVGYASGRRLGRPWLERRGERWGHSVERAQTFYRRWGWSALVVARFIPWLRTFTPILAGVARMPYAGFLAANLAGALVWGSGLVLLGYLAHDLPWLRHAAYAVAALALAASLLGIVVLHRRTRRSP
jgi:membrane-associated protein